MVKKEVEAGARSCPFEGERNSVEENGEGDIQPETPTLSWYREQVVKKHHSLVGDGTVGMKEVDLTADALRESMRPISAALVCVGTTVVMGVGVLYNFDTLAKGLAGVATDNQATVTAASAAFTLAPEVIAALLRSQGSTQRTRRIGSLLLAFAYLQAGMLGAVLSVLNFCPCRRPLASQLRCTSRGIRQTNSRKHLVLFLNNILGPDGEERSGDAVQPCGMGVAPTALGHPTFWCSCGRAHDTLEAVRIGNRTHLVLGLRADRTASTTRRSVEKIVWLICEFINVAVVSIAL